MGLLSGSAYHRSPRAGAAGHPIAAFWTPVSNHEFRNRHSNFATNALAWFLYSKHVEWLLAKATAHFDHPRSWRCVLCFSIHWSRTDFLNFQRFPSLKAGILPSWIYL
jgi:hypothetical protein